MNIVNDFYIYECFTNSYLAIQYLYSIAKIKNQTMKHSRRKLLISLIIVIKRPL